MPKLTKPRIFVCLGTYGLRLDIEITRGPNIEITTSIILCVCVSLVYLKNRLMF